jgi:hypothetical protein
MSRPDVVAMPRESVNFQDNAVTNDRPLVNLADREIASINFKKEDDGKIKELLGDGPLIFDPAAEETLPPERRLEDLALTITDAKDYAEKRDDMVDIIGEQQKITEDALTAFENHPAMETLLPETEQEYNAVLDAVRNFDPELLKNSSFMQLLYHLPDANYSGNPAAQVMFDALMQNLDQPSQAALQKYKDKIDETIKNNPELVGDYRNAYNTFAGEKATEELMWEFLDTCDEIFTEEH